MARPKNCECDNTHEQNNTCCMPCWKAGFRTVNEEANVEECPVCHEFCNGDVTIADHGKCYDCHKSELSQNEEQEA